MSTKERRPPAARPATGTPRTAVARQATQQQRTLLVRAGAGVAAALAVAGFVTLGALTGKDGIPATHNTPGTGTSAAGSVGSALPPWPNAADPSAAIRAAGLMAAGTEGSAEHYHAHLDVIVNGNPVPVAAEIGVDERAKVISPLHTHDPGGVVHVEAPTVGSAYTLGQLFTQWDVTLSPHQLGGLHTGDGNTLTAYVNGKPVVGDPAAVRLAAHQEIVLVYGSASQQVDVPATFDFGTL